jgi:RimJ/RimL family protein N-acetyltransferase
MMPGMGKMQKQAEAAGFDDKMLKRQIALIQSMTKKERANPDLLQASRKKRIAAGRRAGCGRAEQASQDAAADGRHMKKLGKGGMLKQAMRDVRQGRRARSLDHGRRGDARRRAAVAGPHARRHARHGRRHEPARRPFRAGGAARLRDVRLLRPGDGPQARHGRAALPESAGPSPRSAGRSGRAPTRAGATRPRPCAPAATTPTGGARLDDRDQLYRPAQHPLDPAGRRSGRHRGSRPSRIPSTTIPAPFTAIRDRRKRHDRALALAPDARVPVLDTARLRLRAPVLADFEHHAAFHASDRSRFEGGPRDRAPPGGSGPRMSGLWLLRGYGPFGVDDREGGAYLGEVGVFQAEGYPGPELGWFVLPEAEGRGIAFEAARAVMGWLRGAVRLGRDHQHHRPGQRPLARAGPAAGRA